MTSIDHDADSYPRSDAWADLGGGAYTYYREGTLRGNADTSKARLRNARPVDPDAQVLGSRADVTAPREQLDNNLRHIREMRAAGIAGDATVAEHVEVAPEQQQLFEEGH